MSEPTTTHRGNWHLNLALFKKPLNHFKAGRLRMEKNKEAAEFGYNRGPLTTPPLAPTPPNRYPGRLHSPFTFPTTPLQSPTENAPEGWWLVKTGTFPPPQYVARGTPILGVPPLLCATLTPTRLQTDGNLPLDPSLPQKITTERRSIEMER